VPEAAIRIVQYSAGAGSSGGNRIPPNRRQQQQKDGRFDFFLEFLRFFVKKNGILALKTKIFIFFFKSVGFPTLKQAHSYSYNEFAQ